MSEEDRNPREQDEMSANIVTIPKDGELRRFFERLRAAGTLTVNDGGHEFSVKISRSQMTNEARDFLARGGPISE
ncbi:hypothetical protein CO657_22655 (plasmid) [Rhizobium acidisoli]|uniref:Uncharacterized protein n=1 Tax=Rhizobium acidisoli TaxID=1538158 RepID=A0AAE5U127_9HYPH|nr:hypothetical protein [Rhizobium acidisoli]KPH04682.1 hypothetical protein AOG23_31750 [Rhizobium acidisoli]QAS80850.1 hypothetical protein CO657_22655 [Rhizobium acidisoli]